jgi:hypothetical protein
MPTRLQPARSRRIGSGATSAREPSQVRKEAALSGSARVPPGRLIRAASGPLRSPARRPSPSIAIFREGCESGRIGTLGKRVRGNPPWVRIPLPPRRREIDNVSPGRRGVRKRNIPPRSRLLEALRDGSRALPGEFKQRTSAACLRVSQNGTYTGDAHPGRRCGILVSEVHAGERCQLHVELLHARALRGTPRRSPCRWRAS